MPTVRAAVLTDAVAFWSAAGFTVEGNDARWSRLPHLPGIGAGA